MEQPGYEKRGYLHEDFHLFHLCDAMREPVDWHYHTFHKLCVYLGGDAIRYGIEGRSYALEPGDLILVPQGCVHRPEVEPGAAYERMLLYLSPEFLRRSSTEEAPLETCFLQAAEDFRFVVRTGARNAAGAGKTKPRLRAADAGTGAFISASHCTHTRHAGAGAAVCQRKRSR